MKKIWEKYRNDFWKIAMKTIIFWVSGGAMVLSWHLLHGPWIWPIQAVLTGAAFIAISKYDWDSDDLDK